MQKTEIGIRVGQFVTRHPWRVIAVSVLLIAAAALGGRNLYFTTDYRVFFSEVNPELLAFEEMQQVYTKNDNVMFVLAPGDGRVFTRETLDAVSWLTEQAWQIPYSIRVDSVSNFQHTVAEQDELLVGDLVEDALALSDEQLARIERVALAEPQLFRRLIADRSHVTGVNVIIQLPGEQPDKEVPEVVGFSRDLAARFTERYPGIEVHLSGIVLMNISFQEATQSDLRTLVPTMYVIILVMLVVLLRGFTGTFATLLLLTFSILGAMGLAGWARVGLTGPSATAPTIILTLAVADSVHFLSSMYHEMRSNGLDKRAAIVESLRINFQPIFLTSLTTAIGFLTMNAGEVPPFADMGNIVAVGVGIAFALSVTLLPALMTVLPVRARAGQRTGVALMDTLADFVIRRRRILLYGVGGAIVLLVSFVPRNDLNDVFVEYFDESFAFRRSTDFMTENLTGLYDIHYSLNAGGAGELNEPEFLRRVEAFADWYREQPRVLHVAVVTDMFKRLNKNMHGDDPSYHRLPRERELAAQYLLLYEMSLPYGLDLNNQINIDKSATRLSVTMQTMSTNELLALAERADRWLEDNGLPSMRVAGSSTAIMFAHIGYRNIRAMLWAAFGALVVISAILIVALKSWKYGLISLVPNIVPAAAAFGLWGLLVGQVGLALSSIASVTLGIVVDDTIHFMSKYLRARREKGVAGPDAVRYAFHQVGMALTVTTIVLVCGFLVLSLSHFKVNGDLGLMTAITITIALIVDFLFLPPLLLKLEEKRHE